MDFLNHDPEFRKLYDEEPRLAASVRNEWVQRKRAYAVAFEVMDVDCISVYDPKVYHSEKLSKDDYLKNLIRENLDEKSIWAFVEIIRQFSGIAHAKFRGKKRHAEDPKQAAKQQVRECWELWQKEPARYKSKSAFARDMLAKFDDLESQRVIERWCKEWESEPS